jgi:hypothetical protein
MESALSLFMDDLCIVTLYLPNYARLAGVYARPAGFMLALRFFEHIKRSSSNCFFPFYNALTIPPSISNDCPVTYVLAPEHKNTTIFANSSGSP